MSSNIVVIGGGASGLTAAIAAAQVNNNKVVILERKDRVGKKILATGNGRCNLTNLNISKENYYGKDLNFIHNILQEYNPNRIISFFESIGVVCKMDKGRVYPYSNNAVSVLTCLRNKLTMLGIKEITDFHVEQIKSNYNSYNIISKEGKVINADKVIVATGGCASENLGSDGSGFKLLKNLGHSCTSLAPALVQIKIKENLKSLKGVKVEGIAKIKNKNKILGTEYGEILFTDYGLSGICIMELSKFLKDYDNLFIELDFLPQYTEGEVYNLLLKRKNNLGQLEVSNFFIGMLNKNLGQVILKFCGIEKFSLKVSDLTNNVMALISKTLKSFNLKVIGTNGFKNAQVTAGGILTSEFYNNTLESKLHKNLYAAGEILDIFGDCGGYNLHFAWSTGLMAGYNCGKRRDSI